ncbi:MAG: solute carrier family 23 protein, partial [bacterium]
MKKQKLWRKCCFLFTALALFIFAPKALAYAEETNRTVIPEGFVLYAESWEANPLGAKAGEELTGSTKPILVEPTSEETLAGDGEVCSTLADAADCLREAMTKRESSVLFTMYFDTEKEIHEAPETIRTLAKEHTGIPTEGDYLLWQYRNIHTGWSYGYGYIASLGKYSWHATYTFTITYYTNAAQEKEVDDAVAAFLADNIRAGMTDYEKVKAIHDFICKTVTYDHKNLEDESYMLKYTAYAALINHTAVCQGYALLFYRLCLEANVDARYLSGIGYSTLGSGGHGWNLVKLGSHYYNIDCTWDENISDKRNPENIILSYKYFLRTDGNFADHVRDDEYKTAEFYAAYPMGAWQNLLVATVTLASALVFHTTLRGIAKQLYVLLGMLVGYAVSICFGMVDFGSMSETVREMGVVAIPQVFAFKPVFRPGAIISFCLVFIVSAVETIGDTTATCTGGLNRDITAKEISGS